jgi:hypothetical protein
VKQAINNIIYDTDSSEVLASGSDLVCLTVLYRTKKGNYFKHITLDHLPEPNESIEILSITQAVKVYNKLSNRFFGFREAFPLVEFSEA